MKRNTVVTVITVILVAVISSRVAYCAGKRSADRWYDSHTLFLVGSPFKGPLSLTDIESTRMQCILGVTSDYRSSVVVFVKKLDVDIKPTEQKK